MGHNIFSINLKIQNGLELNAAMGELRNWVGGAAQSGFCFGCFADLVKFYVEANWKTIYKDQGDNPVAPAPSAN